jgi:undecaprenyl-diphosphatase
MIAVTNLGTGFVLFPLCFYLIWWLYVTDAKRAALVLGGALSITCGLTAFIKWAIFTPGDVLWDHENAIISQYFPSGHTMLSAMVYGAYGWVAHRRGHLPAALALGIAGIIMALVGWSRIAIIAHPWGDVIGGAVLGMGGVASFAHLSQIKPLPLNRRFDLFGPAALIFAVTYVVHNFMISQPA